jgi:hypothetical protein
MAGCGPTMRSRSRKVGPPGARHETLPKAERSGPAEVRQIEDEASMMNSFMIQLRSCPWCGILRTGRQMYSATSFCFNCRLLWEPPAEARQCAAVQVAANTFCREELARLQVYRAAVRIGFYTDWPRKPIDLTNRAYDASSERA